MIILFLLDGSTFKLKGCILSMSFLDCNGALIPYSYESWKDDSTDSKDRNSMCIVTLNILYTIDVSIRIFSRYRSNNIFYSLIIMVRCIGIIGSQGKCTNSRMSPSMNAQVAAGDGFEDRQFVVLASEKQARVVALPSQNCLYRQQLAETHIVIKAEITSLKGAFIP